MRRLLCGLLLLTAFGCGVDPGIVDDEDAGQSSGRDGGALNDGGTGDSGTPVVRRILSLSLQPNSLTLDVDAISGVSAIAMFDDGTEADVSGTVQWSVTAPDVVDVSLV